MPLLIALIHAWWSSTTTRDPGTGSDSWPAVTGLQVAPASNVVARWPGPTHHQLTELANPIVPPDAGGATTRHEAPPSSEVIHTWFGACPCCDRPLRLEVTPPPHPVSAHPPHT